ncbi:MAG: response regulator [Lentisphaerae bacterium]|nr:response regulator [Lentisphaerota bacterium]
MPERVSRVLLVEDDEEDYIIVLDQLSKAEGHLFEMTRVDCLQAALRHLRETDVDAVLLDLSLPDSQGEEMFDEIHEHAPNTPLVILTGLDDETMAMTCVKKGAQDYLAKGKTDRDRLVRSLRYAIERKRSEEALTLYKDHLEDLVKRRTVQLKRTNTRLRREISQHKKTETTLRETLARVEEHDRAKTEFVSNVSHELRTPLSSMTYAVKNMLKGVLGELPPKVQAYVAMLSEDCQRLAGTVEDILDLTRIEAHTLVLNCVKMPFARLVRDTVDSLQGQAGEKRLNLSFSADDSSGFAECDPGKTERVIINLVSNAIKYTPEGGSVRVTLRPEPDDNGFLVLDVVDDGVGIDSKLLSRVTERYFRIGEHVAGTGLGLSLCKDLLGMQGGRLALKSPPDRQDRGTQATVFLPAAIPPVVLVIDDEEAALTLIEEQLRRAGYDVRTCTSGREGLDAIAECKPDVVITDLMLPDLDGTEIIATLKGDHTVRHIPIIVVTGAELDRGRRDILESFAVPAIAKPWKVEELLGCMNEAVTGKHYLRQ